MPSRLAGVGPGGGRPDDPFRVRMPVRPRQAPDASQGVLSVSDHSMADLLGQDTSKATRFAGVPDGLYERHLVFDHVIDSRQATRRERFEAVARALRDLLSQRWLQTQMA